MKTLRRKYFSLLLLVFCLSYSGFAQMPSPGKPIVLHAARLLDIENGRIIKAGEVLVKGDKIIAAGSSVDHPADAEGLVGSVHHH